MHPDLVKEFITAFTAEVNRERQAQEIGIHQRRRELLDVNRRLNGLIEAIADGLRSPGLQQKLEELETRKARLEIDLSSLPAPKPRLHPSLAELYRRKVSELEAALHDPDSREEAIQILRGLIQYVEIQRAEKGFDVEFVGDIAQMIITAHPERKLEVDRHKSSVKVVAEEGLELRPTDYDAFSVGYFPPFRWALSHPCRSGSHASNRACSCSMCAWSASSSLNRWP
jgi:site-specific DNA recombinase